MNVNNFTITNILAVTNVTFSFFSLLTENAVEQ